MPELWQELAKGVISLVVTLVALGFGWLVGQRLTYQWNLRQKRRELELATAQDLQRLYGEFFAIWKIWNAAVRAGEMSERKDLLRRAADAEGLLERVLIKLTTERQLPLAERETLGKFRQGYQKLRGAIKAEKLLPWVGSEHPEYLAFKRLAVAITLIVLREGGVTQINAQEAFENLRDITSNRHEGAWATEGNANQSPRLPTEKMEES